MTSAPSTVCRVRSRAAVLAALLRVTWTAVVAVGVAFLVLAMAPAAAAATLLATVDDGEEPGPGLSVIQTLGIFVGIPLLLFTIIAVLVAAPSAARGPRYRPGLGWWAAPVWFNGPDDAERAVRESAGSASQGGGASARW
jgi:hypothetical protein